VSANLLVMPGPARKLEILYNSACPVCDAGVKRHQDLMQASTARGETAWTDVTCHAEALGRASLTLEQVRRHIYVRDADGTLHRGADAFAVLWRATPGLRWLGALMSLPGLRTLARFTYDWFADRLYNWNQRRGRW
jgi:predicted DCC family thiol-disulfide oxidoreductase YuxK